MRTRTLPKAKRDQLRAALAEGKSETECSRALKIDRGTVRSYKRNPERFDAPDAAAVADLDPADALKAAEERRARSRELAIEREALQAVAGERSFRAFLDGLIKDAVPRLDVPPKYREPKRVAATVEESLILLLSDWHAYEVVKPERVYGLNDYNADVLGRRVWRITNAARSVVTKLRAGGWRFPRLVVAANGDFISGTIHEVEKHSDAPNVIQAAIGCGMLLAQSLRDLAAVFELVEVFGTSGNHGRLPDHKRVSQKDPSRSWDYLIYSVARQALADCPNVRFYLPDSYSAVYEVEGWRFAQNHGHDVKSWNAIPFYGISRAVTGLNSLLTAAGTPINYFLYSHFHNPGSIAAAGGEYFVNGSLIGGTEFSVNALGRADKPAQWLLGVHRDHGVTHRWPLQAEGAGPEGTYDVRPWAKAA
jgi:hypothetical protein